jgi:hypothetical protein
MTAKELKRSIAAAYFLCSIGPWPAGGRYGVLLRLSTRVFAQIMWITSAGALPDLTSVAAALDSRKNAE